MGAVSACPRIIRTEPIGCKAVPRTTLAGERASTHFTRTDQRRQNCLHADFQAPTNCNGE